MSQKHILIVDDDRALLSTLAAALETDGRFRVSTADTAAAGAAAAMSRDERFDVIMLDLELPDGDGSELCARLRKAGVRVPIVILTGSTDEAAVVRGLDAGANDYV